jgi:hypothetical protein
MRQPNQEILAGRIQPSFYDCELPPGDRAELLGRRLPRRVQQPPAPRYSGGSLAMGGLLSVAALAALVIAIWGGSGKPERELPVPVVQGPAIIAPAPAAPAPAVIAPTPASPALAPGLVRQPEVRQAEPCCDACSEGGTGQIASSAGQTGVNSVRLVDAAGHA